MGRLEAHHLSSPEPDNLTSSEAGLRGTQGEARAVLIVESLTECVYPLVLARQLPHKIVNLVFTISN